MDFGEVMRAFSENRQSYVPFFENNNDLSRMYQLYNAGIKELRTKLEILDSEFMLMYEHDPIHHIEYRLKSPRSIEEKLWKKNMEFKLENVGEHINDVGGIRVICCFLEDIYHVSGLLLAQNDVELVQKKDYIVQPKPSGYRSLHLVVSVPVYFSDHSERVKVEIQFRTIAMDFWASLEHQLKYKSGKDVPESLRDELLDCADSISNLDRRMQRIHRKINEEPFRAVDNE